MEPIWLLAIPVAFVAIGALVFWRQNEHIRILDEAPKCQDCKHAMYLSRRKDEREWGLKWSDDDGYYCALTEYRTSTHGRTVSGMDQKRAIKCQRARELKCGRRAKFFEPEDQTND